MKGLPLSTIRALCVLACLLLPVLTWSETFFDLVKEADAATVQAAIDAGADLEARTVGGWTPLIYAASYSENAAVVQLLLDAAGSVDSPGADRYLDNLSSVFSVDAKEVGGRQRCRRWSSALRNV